MNTSARPPPPALDHRKDNPRSTHAPEDNQGFSKRSTRAPEGQQAPSPGQASAAKRHPGLRKMRSDTPPEGAKATTEAFKPADADVKTPAGTFNPPNEILPVTAFAPSGGVSLAALPNPGCRSLRSLALGWELIAPSGRALNACCPCGGRGPGTCNPVGARVERWSPCGGRELETCNPFGAGVKRLSTECNTLGLELFLQSQRSTRGLKARPLAHSPG